ncbi:RNA-dependent RNA polymerase [Verticillium dahliae partitivirus 1]|uniref:RNA-dependent RNA polymerase n=1 Tax=Verticillium dahliae partitivirus 1 TaxID=1310424 RepID=UPI0006B26085|nr:RNA-dependent RNA polymerase [Verticillium dahliae partitivirus 1]AIN34927.1 RNA-dependent RNA polymerase [Verticillium dahliae partitivirus 1]
MEDFTQDPTTHNIVAEGSHLIDALHLRPPKSRSATSEDVVSSNFRSPNLAEIAKYGGYSTYSSNSNTDPYVRETLKLFSRDTYEDIRGFTRRPQGTPGMYTALKKFSGERNTFGDLSPSQQSSMRRAIGKAKKAFKLPYKREPLDWHEVGQFLRRDTAAGATFMGQKKGDVMEAIYHEARWLGHRMKQDGRAGFDPTRMRFPPCLAGQRGGMSEIDDPKTRLVWIYPAEMLVVEGFYAPLMYRDFMSDPNSPMLNGKSAQRLYTEWCCKLRDGETLYGIDFSSFDTKVPAWLIRVAFDILRQNINFETFGGKPVDKQDAQKWRNVWDAMVWYFINTPILMPDGRMFRKFRGVPSGSWWTQMIDSVVNHILIDYLADCQRVEIRNLRVLGDDSAFCSGDQFDLELAKGDCEPTGMVIKPEKCERTKDPGEFKLLGTTYRGGHVFRDTEEWFKLALYPESSVLTLDISFTRLIGLWLGGAMWDKRFCEYMDFFQSSYPCPEEGWFSKDQKRWLEIIYSGKAPRGWTSKKSLFWRSIFYAYG